MKASAPIRVVIIWLTSCGLFLLFGLVLGGWFHTGPHDWYQLPGITIEHRYGQGLRVESVQPFVLALALGVSYLITWYLFRVASRYGKK